MSRAAIRTQYADIITDIETEYLQAASWLPFDALRIKELFTVEELGEIRELIDQLDSASDDYMERAVLIANAQRFGSTMLKLLRLARVL
ncbi:MAG: hypothetical protein ACYTF7_10720 [Planctomycetota bacterium]|jgi:hypothetical protein